MWDYYGSFTYKEAGVILGWVFFIGGVAVGLVYLFD